MLAYPPAEIDRRMPAGDSSPQALGTLIGLNQELEPWTLLLAVSGFTRGNSCGVTWAPQLCSTLPRLCHSLMSFLAPVKCLILVHKASALTELCYNRDNLSQMECSPLGYLYRPLPQKSSPHSHSEERLLLTAPPAVSLSSWHVNSTGLGLALLAAESPVSLPAPGPML